MPTFTPIDFDPFAEVKEIEKIILTNEPQREIWLSCILGGDDANLSYNESVSLKIKGDLHIPAFERAVNDLVRRHEALRSTISPNGETLIIYKSEHIGLGLIDISGLSEPVKTTELKSFIRDEINTPLDLKNGPLLKVFLHRTGNQEYVFTIIKHHIIGDGWSTGIILEDLSRMYNAYKKGEEPRLDKAYQLSDYAAEQTRFKASAEYKETEDFWLDLYKDKVPALDMPVDRARRSPRSYKGSRFDYQLPKEFVAQIRAIGAKAGCSLVTTLLAAFEVFLYEKTEQTDIVVGLPSSGQAATGLTELVGHCVNLLPLKSHVDPEKSFTDYLKKRKREVLDAYDHQRITFGELIKKLYIPRDAARIALVPVIFNIDMGMDNAVAFDGLQFRLISNPRDYENFEIFLNATGSADGLTLEWSYNTGLFDNETIERFNTDYRTILEKVVANPNATIASLAEVQTTGSDKSYTAEVYIPERQTFNTLFAQTVQDYGRKTAVSFHNSSLTYKQLSDKTDQLTAYLLEKGIKTGDIIALSVDRSVEMLVCLLGCLKSGAVYLPLDPEFPLDRIDYMLEDSAAKLLVVSSAYKGKYKSSATEIIVEELWPQLDKLKLKAAPEVTGADLAYVIYTSGSTGKPKGVKLSHRNLVNFLLSMQKTPGILDSDRLLAITTISFDIAGLELYLPLISGAEVVIADNEAIKDGRILISILAEQNISMMQATPSTWQMMLDSGWEKKSHLKALVGGEALPKDLAEKILTRASTLWNMYGPTETTIWSTVKQVFPGDSMITIGRPIDNTQVYIIDEDGRRVSDGVVGEIYIGGAGVAAGYLNRPELTAERFVKDKYSKVSGARVYRTGDLGKIADNGEIICLGRIDHQVKIRGHRIELGEIESALAKQKEVNQSVVTAWENTPSDKRLVAYVILSNGLANTEGEIPREVLHEWRTNLIDTLPGYMVPDDFIAVKSFPLTPNAKIDRKALPKPQHRKAADTAVAARRLTHNEQLIADIWAGVLSIQDIDPSDDFFELGGHSLLAVKVMVEIEKKTGERLPLATLFNHSTIEKLASQLNADKAEQWDTIVPIKISGTKPPLYLVHGSGLNLLMFKPISDHFDEDQPLYGIQAIGITKKTDVPDSVEEVAAYHIKELLKINPQGPYNLAGYSYGGFIAYEIAKQLMVMGKKVNLLGMIDTNASALLQPKGSTARLAKKVARQFYKVPFFVNSFIKYPKESIEYQRLVWKRKLGSKPAAMEITIDAYTLYEQKIRGKYNYLMEHYDLQPMNAEITLFRVEKRLYFLDDQKYLGWDKVAKKGVRVFTTPGDHKTFLEPPNDQKFARVIQSALS